MERKSETFCHSVDLVKIYIAETQSKVMKTLYFLPVNKKEKIDIFINILQTL